MNNPKKATKRKPAKRQTIQKLRTSNKSTPNGGRVGEGDACDQLTEEFRALAESKMQSVLPAQDVCQIAVQLLKGDDYERAAKRAFDLADACHREAQSRWLEEEMIRPTKRIPFSRATCLITGLSDLPYAKKVYRQFYVKFMAPAAAFASQEPAVAADDPEPTFPYRIELVVAGESLVSGGHEIEVEQWADTLTHEEQARGIGIVQAIFRRALFLMWKPSKNRPNTMPDFSWDK